MDRKASYEVKYETYEKQRADPQCWVTGHAITAQYTDEAILVYQAFENSIGNYAVKHQTFVGCPTYSTQRMTWIKTNFTWMMFRSGWGKKKNQERILGIWLKREAFEGYLRQATKKGSGPGQGTVRLQWDPHHDLDGTPIPLRRAIQLGLKGVQGFSDGTDILAIVDMTPFVSTHDQEKGPLEVLYPLTQDLENILGITKAQQKKKKGRNQQSSSSEEEEATGDD